VRQLRHVVGLDLGCMGDYSALALLRESEQRAPPGLPTKPSYEVPTLKRWPLGTSYTAVGKSLARFFAQPNLAGAELAVDETGVGLAVVELVARELADAGVRVKWVRVTITGGAAVTRQSLTSWHVAKRQLVSSLSAVVHGGRLQVAADQPEADALVREMSTFKSKISLATGNESFEAWRERDHDDLVLAVALACWAAERPRARAGAT
jgi:hypothetical protein